MADQKGSIPFPALIKTNFMTLLIANAHESLIRKYFPKMQLVENTKNTSTIKVNQATYDTAYHQIKADGYNPFALMTVISR